MITGEGRGHHTKDVGVIWGPQCPRCKDKEIRNEVLRSHLPRFVDGAGRGPDFSHPQTVPFHSHKAFMGQWVSVDGKASRRRGTLGIISVKERATGTGQKQQLEGGPLHAHGSQ